MDLFPTAVTTPRGMDRLVGMTAKEMSIMMHPRVRSKTISSTKLLIDCSGIVRGVCEVASFPLSPFRLSFYFTCRDHKLTSTS